MHRCHYSRLIKQQRRVLPSERRILRERYTNEVTARQLRTVILPVARNGREEYRIVPGAAQRTVYLPITQNGLGEPLTELTIPVRKCTKRPAAIKMIPASCYGSRVSFAADAGGPNPVSYLSPMQNNERAWYTVPLSTLALIAVDIPGTVIGNAAGCVYTLLSQEQSFTMQVDNFNCNYMPSLSRDAQ